MDAASHRGNIVVGLAFAALIAAAVLICSPATRNSRRVTSTNIATGFWVSPRPVPLNLIRRVENGMTPEEVNSILGFFDGFFYSMSREEHFGEWTIEYSYTAHGVLGVTSVKKNRL